MEGLVFLTLAVPSGNTHTGNALKPERVHCFITCFMIMPITMETSQRTRGTIVAPHNEGYSVCELIIIAYGLMLPKHAGFGHACTGRPPTLHHLGTGRDQ